MRASTAGPMMKTCLGVFYSQHGAKHYGNQNQEAIKHVGTNISELCTDKDNITILFFTISFLHSYINYCLFLCPGLDALYIYIYVHYSTPAHKDTPRTLPFLNILTEIFSCLFCFVEHLSCKLNTAPLFRGYC